MGEFRFKQFSVCNERSPLKVGTDAVLLGALMTLRPEDRTALDVGTGTGVIALMVAQRQADCIIDAIDIDSAAAQEASENFSASPWADRLRAGCIDLKLFSAEVKYNLIFSNPPYFENSLSNPDEREAVARHTSGLSYRDIIKFCTTGLSEEGRLSLILPAEEESMLRRTAASFSLHLFRIVRIRTTVAKKVSRIVAEFSFHRTAHPSEESLTLQDGPFRTEEYAALTREFYL